MTHRDPNEPVEIVLTGGPGSGKTTGLRHLVDHLTGRGWRVLVVPEAATLLLTGGVADIGHLAATDRSAYLDVQRRLTAMQWGLRDHFRRLAVDLAADGNGSGGLGEGGRTVLLHDRAVLDNAAYMSATEFADVVRDATGHTPAEAAATYDAVIHLVTAADGAAEHYTLANNEARTETPETAIAMDRAVQNSWLGHPHFTVIGNPATGGFDAKLTRLLAAVLNIIGEPEPIEDERKWLLASDPPAHLLSAAKAIDIVQHYLPAMPGPNGPVERRVRSRTHDGHTLYFHTTKAPVPGTKKKRAENEERISAETYRHLAAMADPGTVPVVKRRWSLVHDGQHFEIDRLREPVMAWLLEAELVTSDDQVTLPPDLDIDREVTDDPTWRNAAIARRS